MDCNREVLFYLTTLWHHDQYPQMTSFTMQHFSKCWMNTINYSANWSEIFNFIFQWSNHGYFLPFFLSHRKFVNADTYKRKLQEGERGVWQSVTEQPEPGNLHKIFLLQILLPPDTHVYIEYENCVSPRDIFCMLNEAWGESVSSAQLSQWPWATLGRRSLAQQLASSVTGIHHLPRSFFYSMKPWQINAIKSNAPAANYTATRKWWPDS